MRTGDVGSVRNHLLHPLLPSHGMPAARPMGCWHVASCLIYLAIENNGAHRTYHFLLFGAKDGARIDPGVYGAHLGQLRTTGARALPHRAANGGGEARAIPASRCDFVCNNSSAPSATSSHPRALTQHAGRVIRRSPQTGAHRQLTRCAAHPAAAPHRA